MMLGSRLQRQNDRETSALMMQSNVADSNRCREVLKIMEPVPRHQCRGAAALRVRRFHI